MEEIESKIKSERPQNKHLRPRKKGDPKPLGSGVKKGWRSLATQLREELQKLTYAKNGKETTYSWLLINKLMHKAIMEGDMRAMALIWEYLETKPTTPIDITTGGDKLEMTSPLLALAKKYEEELKKSL